MIARLTGAVDQLETDSAIIDVAGVGYLVFASSRTLAALPPKGAPVSLLIETHVREDHIHLYGFPTAAERDWFRLLTSVQGVGARVGLAILSALTPGELIQAVAAQDKTPITRAHGVGPKLAGRIVSELKDRAGTAVLGGRFGEAAGGAERVDAAGIGGGPAEDAISALTNLGYRRVDAYGAVARSMQALGAGASVEALIKAGLKELAQ
jgi:Holliday junction DNA helicase RuvA